MKIIYNRIIPFKGYKAMNFFGIIFARKEFKNKLTKSDLRHEEIHTYQMKDLWYIGFYILYLYWYIKGLFTFKQHKAAYYAIPFEGEAYYGQKLPSYLKFRTKNSWKAFKY